MAVDWADNRVALLSDLWQSGYSARQIAERLGEGVTRNAVIGKANRLGLSKPSKSSVTRQQRQKERAENVLHLQPPIDEGATIFSLTASTCRWPIGDQAIWTSISVALKARLVSLIANITPLGPTNHPKPKTQIAGERPRPFILLM